MSFVQTYGFCALGVALSILLPILRQALPQPKAGTAGVSALLVRLWRKAEPYLALGAFSLLTAPLLIALAGDKISNWQTALLVGYAWDSTIHKFSN